MHDQIAEDVKAERLARLQAAINRNAAAFNARCRGRTFEVLMEKPGRLPGQLTGRSPYLQPVQVMAPERLIGQMVAGDDHGYRNQQPVRNARRQPHESMQNSPSPKIAVAAGA